MEAMGMPRLLIIEDEPGLVLTLTDRLQAEGHDATSVSDGATGLAMALQGGWDLILLDWMLPKKSNRCLPRSATK
jgi:DNA-binding response OmpR family regulator